MLDEVKKDLRRIKELERRGLDNAWKEKQRKEAWMERGRQNERDNKIFKEFYDNAEAGKEKNNNRFRLSYIFNLSVPWNILIVLGKKNIGKSFNIHLLIDECIRENREIIMVRVTAKETISALRPFFNEDRSNAQLRGRGMNIYEIIKKPSNDFERKNPITLGTCCSISTLTSFQGSSFPKVKYIIWDECISDGTNQKITKEQIKAFERFLSSVVREKTDVKTIIFGNLLPKLDNHKGDPLLEYYGIDASCDCKYIPAKSEAHANILFLNTRDMFKGIESQSVLGGVDIETEESLLANSISSIGIKTLDEKTYYNAIPIYSLVFSYNKNLESIHIRAIECDGFPTYLIVLIKGFNVGDISTDSIENNKKAFTNEEAISNMFSHCVSYLDKKTWLDVIDHLISFLEAGRVVYANQESAMIMPTYAKHLKLELKEAKNFGQKFF